uniref:SANT domain-containing protein n=2 Tax=Ciona intestinalis TaxID=7719 RepID=H2XVX1_CIOIN
VKHKLPKGIDLSVDDITTLGEHPGSPHDYISTLEENIVAIKRQVQSLKQECGQFDIREGDLVEQSDEQVVDGWTNTELLLAVKAVRKFGQNYESIAGTIGTKSVAQIKNFFSTYKNELKLDEVLKEHKEEIITNGD